MEENDGAGTEKGSRRALRDAIAVFEPFNEQEAMDQRVILHALDSDPCCFDRSEQAHMACSIWVVDPEFEQTLLVYHNIYDSWSWIGGHADGECDLAKVALRELQEETGVAHARLVMEEACGTDDSSAVPMSAVEDVGRLCGAGGGSALEEAVERALPLCGPGGVYSLEVLTVDGHEKRGAYVSSHLHLNVTYLAIADPAEPLRIKPDENSGVRWVPLEDAIRLSTEPWIRDRIYRKLIGKLVSLAAKR